MNPVVCLGFGPDASIPFVVTLGFGPFQPIPPTPDTSTPVTIARGLAENSGSSGGYTVPRPWMTDRRADSVLYPNGSGSWSNIDMIVEQRQRKNQVTQKNIAIALALMLATEDDWL